MSGVDPAACSVAQRVIIDAEAGKGGGGHLYGVPGAEPDQIEIVGLAPEPLHWSR